MKKLLLLGLAFSAGIQCTDVQAQGWGTQIGKTWYDLQTNTASGNRITRHSDGTISAVWIENCLAGNPSFPTRGTGYNYYDGTSWVEGPDGTCDLPNSNFGINTVRTGWGEIASLPNNVEYSVAHAAGGATFGGIVQTFRTKGQAGFTGWTASTPISFTGNITQLNTIGGSPVTITGSPAANGTWPRIVSSGNTIHMIYAVNNSSTTTPSTANGVESPFAYSRSIDGGATWDMQNVLLPGLDASIPNSINSVGGDSYAIHANGNTVAITAGRLDDSWTLWKSTDNGSTWTSRIFGAITDSDTLQVNSGGTPAIIGFMPDGRQSVVVDNNGTVHAFAGQMAVQVRQNTTGGYELNTDASGSVSYYPLSSDGIVYWNDDALLNSERQLIAVREDIFAVGHQNDWVGNGSYLSPARPSPYAWTGLTSMPSAGVDAANNVYLVYSGVVEGTSNIGDETGQSLRDLYVMRGRPGGLTWSDPVNIAKTIIQVPGQTIAGTDFEEEITPSVYPMIASDNLLHMTWMFDYEPGLAVNGDLDPEVENGIMYYGLDVAANAALFNDALVINPPTGIRNEMAVAKGVMAYPNPTTGQVMVTLGDLNTAKATIKVTNIMGQTVNVPANRSENGFSLDLSAVANGVYIYTITSDNATITSRIVKQ